MPKDHRLRERNRLIARRASLERALYGGQLRSFDELNRDPQPLARSYVDARTDSLKAFSTARAATMSRQLSSADIPSLLASLKQKEIDHRELARNFVRLGKQAVRQLEEKLESCEPIVQYNAVKTLRQFDSVSPLALNRIEQLSRSTIESVRTASLNALLWFASRRTALASNSMNHAAIQATKAAVRASLPLRPPGAGAGKKVVNDEVTIAGVKFPRALCNVSHAKISCRAGRWILATRRDVIIATFATERALIAWWGHFQRDQGRKPRVLQCCSAKKPK